MKKQCFILLLVLCSCSMPGESKAAESAVVRAFESDQCTFWPDNAFDSDWSECCYQHDLSYWAGGSSAQREEVDQELKSCIQESSSRLNAHLMFMGVRLGSLSPVKFGGKQWGNAWGDEVRESSLSKREIKDLERSLFSTLPQSMGHSQIDTFIEKLEQRPL